MKCIENRQYSICERVSQTAHKIVPVPGWEAPRSTNDEEKDEQRFKKRIKKKMKNAFRRQEHMTTNHHVG